MASVNGFEFDFSCITMKLLGGDNLQGFLSIKYGDSVEAGIARGNGRKQRGHTPGREKTDDGTLSVYLATERAIIAALGGSGWCDKVFDMVVQYAATGQPVHTDVLEGFRFLGSDGGGEEGNDPLKRELKFACLRIKRDGAYLTNT